jgi:hypothetical protein
MSPEATDPSAASYHVNNLRLATPADHIGVHWRQCEQIRLGSIATVNLPNGKLKQTLFATAMRTRTACRSSTRRRFGPRQSAQKVQRDYEDNLDERAPANLAIETLTPIENVAVCFI